ncbi:MAG: hypothetical protein KAG96_08225 [Ichthyobacteriaceae bacterium]|nr:hypothetical protein [Ichthyobacteriaceae bacterium]
MKTRLILMLLLGLFLTILPTKNANACEIEFEIVKGKKETYKAGDKIIVLVKVALTHRACPIGMKKTKFKTKGLKVVKSTKWKQISTNDWERKLMIVVEEGDNLNITAVRECDKDGGFGSMKLVAE